MTASGKLSSLVIPAKAGIQTVSFQETFRDQEAKNLHDASWFATVGVSGKIDRVSYGWHD
jgi:hypothetical protein